MARKKPDPHKKYFTVDEANATLPLVRAILRDIAELAAELRERHERLNLVAPTKGRLSEAHREELEGMQEEIERSQERMRELIDELTQLGVELKDPFTGLVDFLAWMNGREVYLCWRHDEPEVAHWHDLHAGFAGRQKLQMPAQHA